MKNMFTRILHVCHKVFFHQINAWVVHAQLVDICEEFFINRIDSSSDKKDAEESTLNKTMTSVGA